MATRFYLPSTGAAPVTPAFGGWTATTAADRRAMVTTRIGSAMASRTSDPLTAANDTELVRQYVSQAMAAQTLSGTIKGQVRGIAGSFGGGALAVRVAVCDSAGGSVAEALSITFASDHASNAPPAFTNAALTNASLEGPAANTFSLTLTSQSVPAGGYILVELGVVSNVGNSSTCDLNFGDNAAADLAEDETTTTADNPWIEFSANLTFATSGGGALVNGGAAAGHRRNRLAA